MAIAKTATRDLTTAIAGEIWKRIKEADEDARADIEIDPAVKRAKRNLDKKNPEEVDVKDSDLRETIANIFGNIDVQLIRTESKVDAYANKISAIGGAIADTQKLIINQNQLLEEKFDEMLSALGYKSDLEKQAAEERKYDQLEFDLEQSEDLSTTSKIFKGLREGKKNSEFDLDIPMRFLRGSLLQHWRTRNKWFRRNIRGRTRLFKWRKIRATRNLSRIRSGITSGITRRLPRGLTGGLNNLRHIRRVPRFLRRRIPGINAAGSIMEYGDRRASGQTNTQAIAGAGSEFLGGWAGAAAGAKGGAAIGAMIGSIIPGAGTAAGALIGGILGGIGGGILGSWGAGSLSDRVTGVHETGKNLNVLGNSAILPVATPIVSVVKEFGKNIGYSMDAVISEAGLSDVPVERVSTTFNVGGKASANPNIASSSPAMKAPRINKKREQQLTDAENRTKTDNPLDAVVSTVSDTLETIDRSEPVETIRRYIGSEHNDGFIGPAWMGFRNPLYKPDPAHTNENDDTSEGTGNINQDAETTSMISTILPQGNPVFTSGYGMRWGKLHAGVDYGVDAGSPVMSALDGVVTHKGSKFGEYGGYVVVNDVDAQGNKLSTANLYGHVKNINVNVGDKIKKGHHLADIVYYPHTDGRDWSHLHFERFDGPGSNDQIDPLSFLQGTSNPQLQSQSLTPPSIPVASSLNSTESPVPNLVSDGSMERQFSIKKRRSGMSVVIINNQIIKATKEQVAINSGSNNNDHIEAFKLMRLG